MQRPFSTLLMANPKSLTDAELERLIREADERLHLMSEDSGMRRSIAHVRANAEFELRTRPVYTVSIHGGDRAQHAQRVSAARHVGVIRLSEAEAVAKEMLLAGEHMCVWGENQSTPRARFKRCDDGSICRIHE